MLTAGANIASSMQAAAVITDAAAMKPIMVIGPTAITMMITTAIIMAIITKATGGMLADMKGIPAGMKGIRTNISNL